MATNQASMEQITNASTSGSNNNTNVNYSLLKLYVDTIPNFDGNPHTLAVFINNCTSLINNFYKEGDDIHNNFISRAIIGKLTGRALTLIGSRVNELETWENIKSALELSFGDQRNLDCLVQDLITLSSNKGKTPYNFGMRCQDARTLIFSKLNTLNLTTADKELRTKNYDELALKTFIRGLTGTLQNNIRIRNPENLEKAMSLVIEEENFLYSQQRSNTLNTHNFRPTPRIIPFSHSGNARSPNFPNNHNVIPRINQPQNNFPQNNFRPNHFQNRPYFPNFNQNSFRQIAPQNNFAQRPVFGQSPFFSRNNVPQYNFMQRPNYFNRPSSNQAYNPNRFNNNQNQNNVQQLHEPMDISSGYSRQKPNQLRYTEISNEYDYDHEFDYDYNNYIGNYEEPYQYDPYYNQPDNNVNNTESSNDTMASSFTQPTQNENMHLHLHQHSQNDDNDSANFTIDPTNKEAT
ncbi:GATA zinc finger domain-containing protein 14-like [Anthonomus grandis grandis]|uniref:GATA zinc finger domain-containing protein 14-like n=1 Tax=Anthonomus grandis grandis TaxID=2921223 RepID=UPI002166B63D|nr:GATA zinc finger domain-containing protein 14-like [Anthonomus grandis grandis]